MSGPPTPSRPRQPCPLSSSSPRRDDRGAPRDEEEEGGEDAVPESPSYSGGPGARTQVTNISLSKPSILHISQNELCVVRIPLLSTLFFSSCHVTVT